MNTFLLSFAKTFSHLRIGRTPPLNKRKRVAWRKHRRTKKRGRLRRKAEREAGSAPARRRSRQST